MDSEHRHDLKTNELAGWISQTPEFVKRNASTIIGVVLIIIGLMTWPMFNRMRAEAGTAEGAAVAESIQNLERDIYAVIQAGEKDAEARQQATSTLLVSANALLEQADKTDDADVAALARIKAAQALRAELHFRADMIDVQDAHTRVGQAQEAYKKAAETAVSPTLKAMAQFGLGLCAEELGQRDEAAAIYKAIVDAKEYVATIFPAQAQRRMDGLDENMSTVTFAPAPLEAAPEEPQVQAAPEAVGQTEVVQPATAQPAPAAPAAETSAAAPAAAEPAPAAPAAVPAPAEQPKADAPAAEPQK